MNERLTALETHFGYVRRDLDELKAGQSDIHRSLLDVSQSLNSFGGNVEKANAAVHREVGDVRRELSILPTKNDLWSWKLQWTAIGFAMVALIVGGIIGGLAWIAP